MANITGSIADAGRLIHLAKRRERAAADIEKQKKQVAEDARSKVGLPIPSLPLVASHGDEGDAQGTSTTSSASTTMPSSRRSRHPPSASSPSTR